MSKRQYCDRCGAEGSAMWTVGQTWHNDGLDLCSRCQDDFWKWAKTRITR